MPLPPSIEAVTPGRTRFQRKTATPPRFQRRRLSSGFAPQHRLLSSAETDAGASPLLPSVAVSPLLHAVTQTLTRSPLVRRRRLPSGAPLLSKMSSSSEDDVERRLQQLWK